MCTHRGKHGRAWCTYNGWTQFGSWWDCNVEADAVFILEDALWPCGLCSVLVRFIFILSLDNCFLILVNFRDQGVIAWLCVTVGLRWSLRFLFTLSFLSFPISVSLVVVRSLSSSIKFLVVRAIGVAESICKFLIICFYFRIACLITFIVIVYSCFVQVILWCRASVVAWKFTMKFKCSVIVISGQAH